MKSIDNQSYTEHKAFRFGAPVLLFLLALAGFLQTVQRTTSFWDCGEFIATSYILGVPHPPGAPFFNLIGRFFALLPLGGEVAWRINLISVLSSAGAVLFLYLIIRHILDFIFPLKNIKDSMITCFSAFAAALMGGFADTFWFNAVEAEVYGIAMFIMLLSVYLSLIWYKHRKQEGSDRYFIFMIYVMFLGIGAHLFSLLLFPAIFVLMVFANRTEKNEYMRGVWGLVLMFVAAFIFNKLNAPGEGLMSILHYPLRDMAEIFLYVLPSDTASFIMTLRPEIIIISWLALAVTMGMVYWLEKKKMISDWKYWVMFFQLTLVIYAIDFFLWINISALALYGILSLKSKFKHKFRFLFITVLVAMIGYSTYLYVPIRSNLNPRIDENNPETWQKFKVYLERKQYDEPDIWSRITKRYADWSWQFMYMYNYLKNQYSSVFIFPIFLLAFFYGFYVLWKYRRDPKISAFVYLILLIVFVGLIIYMNFSDGSRGKHAEVRDRDYFHTPTYLIFNLFMGVGFAGFFYFLKDELKLKSFAHYLSIPMLLLPSVTYFHNLDHHDRSKDYLPHDYGYNILASCPENSILFTQGDNDTFPLWFLQEVMKTRLDVKVVNLSLLNAPWYIKQLKSVEPKVNFSFSDEKIDSQLRGAYPLVEDDYEFKYKNIQTVIPRNSYLRIQDIGVMELIRSNYGERPICFSMTVGPDGRIGFDKYFVQKGMVFEIADTAIKVDSIVQDDGTVAIDTVRRGPIIDRKAMEERLLEKFRYTNLQDSTTYLGKEGSRYVKGYADLFDKLADSYRKSGNDEKALEILTKSTEILPYVGLSHFFLAMYYFENKDYDQAIEYFKVSKSKDDSMDWLVDYYTAIAYKLKGDLSKALDFLETIAEDPEARGEILKEAISICIQNQNKDRAIRFLDKWQKSHPNDQEAYNIRTHINQLFKN